MEQLSSRVRSMAPSRTIAMNQRARSLRESGVDVIDLTVGEPDFPTPEPIRAAAKAAIDQGHNFYTPVPGYGDLREAVIRKFSRENSLSYPLPSVMVSAGAKQCVANSLLALVDPGDEVVIPAPHWVSYAELVKLADGLPVSIPTKASEGYKLSPQALADAISEKTKAIILCSPSNPTGAVYSRAELEALAGILAAHPRVWVISDEVYEHIDYTGRPHASPASIPSLFDRTVVINGVSKAYAMTGWRIGYLAGPEALVKACISLQGQMTTNASTIAQRASLAALESGTSLIGGMQAAFKRRRELVLAGMRSLPGLSVVEPEGAFYLFPDITAYYGKTAASGSWSGRPIGGSDDFCEYLLEEARVALVPGSAFGDDRCLRLSFASSDDRLAAAITRMGEAIAKLG